MANLLNDKWSLRLSLALSLGFTVLSVSYFIGILKGDTSTSTIISFVIWIISAVAWLLHAIQLRKKMKSKKQ